MEKRRSSARVKAGKLESKPPSQPEPPKTEVRPKKIRKIHARKSSDSLPNAKRDAISTPKGQESSSQASPAPFGRVGKDSPLPVRSLQSPTKPNDENRKPLQSIADSGVVATSFLRSRAKWVNEGIFERYWVKPRKVKKEVIEVPHNPPKDSMVAVGRSKLFIDPHVFEVAIYGIRDTQPVPNLPPTSFGGPSGFSNRPIASTLPLYPVPAPSPVQMAHRPFQNSTPTTPRPAGLSVPVQNQQTSTASTETRPAQNPSPTNQQTSQTPPQPQQQVQQTSQTQPSQQQQQSRPPGQDPVIQRLAQRASENPDLKALMKIVASGQANKEQLAEFQRHIDQITRSLNATPKPQQSPKNPPTGPTALPTPINSANNSQTPARTTPSTAPGATHSTISTPRPVPQTTTPAPTQFAPSPSLTHTATPTPRPYKPSPLAQARFKGIAIEFLNPTAACNSTPNDRLLFPRHSILSYSSDGRKVVASFLVVKRASAAGSSSSLNPSTPSTPFPNTGKRVHVPITISFESADYQALSHLRAGVAPEDEVRKHMDEVVRTTERAPYSQLSLQLPLSDKTNTENQAERRGSLLARASPIEPVPVPRGKKKKEENLEGLCRFCYGEVPSGVTKDADDMALCKSCAALKGKAQVDRKILVEQTEREVRAVLSLAW